MRIGMMADLYKPHISGVTNYIVANKRFLEDNGHEVFIFTLGNVNYPDEELNVVRVPAIPIANHGAFLPIALPGKTKKLLQSMDIVHVHHPFISGQLAIRHCKPMGIPVVFTNHTRYDIYFKTYVPFIPGRLRATFFKKYFPYFCRSIDLVISPSAGMEKVLRTMGVDVPIKVIPNGVDLQLFWKTEGTKTRKEFGFADNDVVFIYMGRIAPEKNLYFLLKAFANLIPEENSFRLMIIGEGPEESALKDFASKLNIADKVTFTGFIPYQNLAGYLMIGDIFVTASISEVHPLSVIESMCVGIPVIGIASPGIEDFIVDGETGLFAEPDLVDYAAKMSILAANRELRKQMGSKAQVKSREFDIKRTTPMVLEQYYSLISNTRSYPK
jgi:1,2-diacylglycerol 3-alpha-glucosyltransferase